MFRKTGSMLDWSETQGGWRSGRYEIVPTSPSGWLLDVSGKPLSRHATITEAKSAASRLERSRQKTRRVVRIGSALVLVTVLFGVVWSMRTETNPARRPAEALVAHFDEVHASLVSGSAALDDIAEDPALKSSLVELNGGEVLVVLMGEAGEECYTLYWSAQRDRRARVLADSLPCEPGPIVASTTEFSYKRQTPGWSRHLGAGDGVFTWDSVLPPETRQRVWFLPALLVLAALLTSALTRLSVVLHPGEASPT